MAERMSWVSSTALDDGWVSKNSRASWDEAVWERAKTLA